MKPKNNRIKLLGIMGITLIVVFSFFKKNKSSTQSFQEQEQAYAQHKTLSQNDSDVSSLRDAYTGNWKKNAPYQPSEDGSLTFQKPQNTRNTIVQNKVITKKDTKKKKIKKKIVKYRLGKSRYANIFDRNGISNNSGFSQRFPYSQTQAKPQDPAKDEEKSLSADEYLSIALREKSLKRLLADLQNGKTNAENLFKVAEAILAMKDQDLLKLEVYKTLSRFISPKSFELIAAHKDSETSQSVRAAANEALAPYTNNPSTIGILTRELGNQKNEIRILASQSLSQLISKVMLSAGQGDDHRNGGMVYTQQIISQLRSTLRPTLAMLNRILQNGNLDAQVTSSFTATRDILNRFLS